MLRPLLGMTVFLALVIAAVNSTASTAKVEGLIAYQRDPRGGISVIPAGGGKPRRVSTRHGQPWYMSQGVPPVWSPDGKWLAIVDERRVPKSHVCLRDDDYVCPSEIYVIHPDGSGERQITPTFKELYGAPVWSPDSRKLLFGAGGDLRVVNEDGSGLQRLNTRASAGVGSWSPDGKTIAYTERQNGSDIFLVGLDGRRIRLTRGGSSSDPSWSPDGRWIAFRRDQPAAGLSRTST